MRRKQYRTAVVLYGLPDWFTATALCHAASDIGSFHDVRLSRPPGRIGYVEFATASQAARAAERWNGTMLFGAQIAVYTILPIFVRVTATEALIGIPDATSLSQWN